MAKNPVVMPGRCSFQRGMGSASSSNNHRQLTNIHISGETTDQAGIVILFDVFLHLKSAHIGPFKELEPFEFQLYTTQSRRD